MPTLRKADAEIASLRRSAQDLARRRTEVEEVRDRFRGAGYDHPNATFGNDGDIADVLGRVLEGAVNSGVLWDLLRGGYRYRQPRGRPDFGAPNFPVSVSDPWRRHELARPAAAGASRRAAAAGRPGKTIRIVQAAATTLHDRRIVLGLIHPVLRLLPKIGVADELPEGAIGGRRHQQPDHRHEQRRQRQAAACPRRHTLRAPTRIEAT